MKGTNMSVSRVVVFSVMDMYSVYVYIYIYIYTQLCIHKYCVRACLSQSLVCACMFSPLEVLGMVASNNKLEARDGELLLRPRSANVLPVCLCCFGVDICIFPVDSKAMTGKDVSLAIFEAKDRDISWPDIKRATLICFVIQEL